MEQDRKDNGLIGYPGPQRGRTNVLHETFSCLDEMTNANIWTLFCENLNLLLKKLRLMKYKIIESIELEVNQSPRRREKTTGGSSTTRSASTTADVVRKQFSLVRGRSLSSASFADVTSRRDPVPPLGDG